jgi:rRNA maturation protein Nop10
MKPIDKYNKYRTKVATAKNKTYRSDIKAGSLVYIKVKYPGSGGYIEGYYVVLARNEQGHFTMNKNCNKYGSDLYYNDVRYGFVKHLILCAE